MTTPKTPKKSQNQKEKAEGALELQGMLWDADDKDLAKENAKAEPKRRREYYDCKAIVMKLEEKNNSKLYVFPSLGGEVGEWYKMGGRSVMYYKYLVGPRMRRKPAIRKDTDIRLRFRHGVCAVHWGERFIEAVKKAGYKVSVMDYDIIVVEIGKKFTAKEIKEMAELEKKDKEKLAKLIVPKENMPGLYAKIRTLAQLLTPKVNKLQPVYREAFGMQMLQGTADLFKIYFRVANGRMSREIGRVALMERVDNLTAIIALTDEVELFDVVSRTRMGEYLVEIADEIAKNFGKDEEVNNEVES